MSKQINDGGPAFPIEATSDHEMEHMQMIGSTGMTLRDWFAGQAVSGLCAFGDGGCLVRDEDVPANAYMIADAMLKARDE